MSRSGYCDDLEPWSLIRWRGAVASAIRGKRGQAFLSELAAALDAMPEKELIANEFNAEGQFCALGVIGAARGIDPNVLDPDDYDSAVRAFGIPRALACEIMYENDSWTRESNEDRWQRMRKWVADKIKRA